MTETMSADAPAGGEPGVFARLAGVLFSPGKTFESIARKPAWAIPVVIVIVWTAIAGFLITQKIDADALFDKNVAKAEKAGRTIPAEQLETQRKVTRIFVKIGFLFGTVFVTAALFLVPLLYHGLSHVLSGPGRYTAVLSAYAHVQVVQIVKGVLFVAVALQKTTIDPEGIPSLLKSNLGAFLDPETTHAGLRTIASAIDVFDLWGMALMILGLQKVRGVSRGTASVIVVGAWLAYVLVSAALATIGASFGG